MFRIEIKTDNDAFAGDPSFEISRILRSIAEKIRRNGLSKSDGAKCMDENGNSVGKWEYES